MKLYRVEYTGQQAARARNVETYAQAQLAVGAAIYHITKSYTGNPHALVNVTHGRVTKLQDKETGENVATFTILDLEAV